MSTEKPTAVRVYLARVRTALADLPAGEVEEILEDVRPHLAEMETELGASARVEALIERLGTPESYAAELRSSGGYPLPPGEEAATAVLKTSGGQGLFGARFALWGMVFCAAGLALLAFGAGVSADATPLAALLLLAPVFALSLWFLHRRGVAAVLALPEAAYVRDTARKYREDHKGNRALEYLGSLKPAWWVVCAVVLVAFGLFMMARHSYSLLVLLFMVAAAAAVVWAGPRTGADRRLLWLVIPISAFVIGGGLGGFGRVIDRAGPFSSQSGTSPYTTAYSSSDQYGNDQLRYGAEELKNVYAFDTEGKPLTDVYLYDEHGRPITITRYGCEQDTGEEARRGEDNRFPRPQLVQGTMDSRGNLDGYNGYRGYCHEVTGVPFAAAVPKPSPVPSRTPSGTPSSTPSSASATSASPAPPTR
ncbi:HAAS signaling domain-containing protein [Amycolatopsis sp. PS_44_ISF1]|uniref:DUF1700 domain-containing protein n=1 Tax=Amycolatopsis sp. PS_44_ISF1 TaxID=2974917 RepID=UPI0028DFC3C4|nr:hypothetical protein [Amycolatopsis sp. PS_44_ISF1]MDT8915584.1 hypothetical protein [Amycolatopsis sp. PS_44_ISF1]